MSFDMSWNSSAWSKQNRPQAPRQSTYEQALEAMKNNTAEVDTERMLTLSRTMPPEKFALMAASRMFGNIPTDKLAGRYIDTLKSRLLFEGHEDFLKNMAGSSEFKASRLAKFFLGDDADRQAVDQIKSLLEQGRSVSEVLHHVFG